MPCVELDEEQDVVAAQHDRVDGEEVARDDPGGLRARNGVHDSALRAGAGSIPAFFKIVQTVDAPIVMPSVASSPWMRR